jgi:hypothetical protein
MIKCFQKEFILDNYSFLLILFMIKRLSKLDHKSQTTLSSLVYCLRVRPGACLIVESLEGTSLSKAMLGSKTKPGITPQTFLFQARKRSKAL